MFILIKNTEQISFFFPIGKVGGLFYMSQKKYIVQIGNCFEKDSVGKFILKKEDVAAITHHLIENKKHLSFQPVKVKIHGQVFKAVRYKELIDLNLFSLKSRRDVVKSFILMLFKDFEVITTDGIKVTMTDNSAAKISRLTYDNQQEIAMNSDKMIQIAELESIAVSFKKKKGVFRYYTAYIIFGKNIFRVTLNLFTDANGTRLYDINKITQITASGTVHGSSGYKYYKP